MGKKERPPWWKRSVPISEAQANKAAIVLGILMYGALLAFSDNQSRLTILGFLALLGAASIISMVLIWFGAKIKFSKWGPGVLLIVGINLVGAWIGNALGCSASTGHYGDDFYDEPRGYGMGPYER